MKNTSTKYKIRLGETTGTMKKKIRQKSDVGLNKKDKPIKAVESKEVNWHNIIALSVAGQYIQNELAKELEKITPIIKKK